MDERKPLRDYDPEGIETKDLNNFYSRLPGGWKRWPQYSHLFSGETFAQIAECDSKQAAFLRGLHSEKRFQQTPEEFFSSIDQAIQELGLDPKTIAQRNEHLLESGFSWPVLKNWYEELIPLYRKLRASGYSHADLTS